MRCERHGCAFILTALCACASKTPVYIMSRDCIGESAEGITISMPARGGLAEITLNAPARLNALSRTMCDKMASVLCEWRKIASPVKAVVIEGAGDRAFCAGGDIRYVHTALASGTAADAIDFFASEYINNWCVHNFEKPCIAIADGITMGGGVGVSLVGNTPVVTERTVFAMPETGIGFMPDVGYGYYLSRLGPVGIYLALTGTQLNARDLVDLGMVRYAISSESRNSLKATLANELEALPSDANYEQLFHKVGEVLGAYSKTPDLEPVLHRNRKAIDRCFRAPSMEGIVDALHQDGSPWAKETIDTMQARCPTMLVAAYHSLATCSNSDFGEVLQRDFAVVNRSFARSDFQEGIRAQIIDKDRKPRWIPRKLDNFFAEEFDFWFSPLAPKDRLVLSWEHVAGRHHDHSKAD